MTDERLEILLSWGFGFTLAIVYWAVSRAVGLGDVTKEKSFGLDIVLASLQTLGVGWGAYMLARLQRSKKEENKP